MKKLLSIGVLLMIYSLTLAQFKQIAEGPKFTEPEQGFAQILQMKNGNTFYVNITLKDGVNVRIYDPSHKQIVVTSVFPSYEVLKTGDIDAIFEINNDLVLFISERDDRTPVLYRLVIDGNTGKLKDQKTVARMKKEGAFVNTSAYNSFSVAKDLYSDNYAVCLYFVMEGDKDKRIEIIHYGNDNNEISRSFCASPDPEYGFLHHVDMVVMGSEKVKAILFASKEKYDMGRKGNLYLASLEKGNAVNYSKLDFSEDFEIHWGLAKYNPTTKEILLMTAAKMRKERDRFIPYLVSIDPVTNKLKRASVTEFKENLQTSFKEQYDKSSNYSGMPQNLFINDDGSFSVVYEEILVQTQSTGNSGGFSFGIGVNKSQQVRVDTKLGKMVVASFDKSGNLVSNYLVPKAHWIIFQELAPFYHARREGSAQQLFRGNQYKSFAYLNGANKNYLLFNDTERNNDVKKDKFVEIQGISDGDAFMYKLTGNEVFPKREYAIENAATAKDHTLLLYAISDYDKKNNVYVTLRLDKETRTSKEVKIVWLQPQ